MDFISHLPRSANGFSSILTVADGFSSRVPFIASRHTDTGLETTNCFFREVFRVHGLPQSIVSDRDPKFTSAFWTHLMNLCDVTLRMFISHHPQIDGDSEIMNYIIENYLRCYCSLHKSDWDELLASAEFSFNYSPLEATGYTPFEPDLGCSPSPPLDSITRKNSTDIHSVEQLRRVLSSSMSDATFSHHLPQARKSAYNSTKYQPQSYKCGEKVWFDK